MVREYSRELGIFGVKASKKKGDGFVIHGRQNVFMKLDYEVFLGAPYCRFLMVASKNGYNTG